MGKDLEALFWMNYSSVLKEAKVLCEDRMPVYVGDETILEYWINGAQDLLYEINKKSLRLRRLFKSSQTSETADKIDDQLIDLINYSAFLYAYLKVFKK